jgi:hypothetical protein
MSRRSARRIAVLGPCALLFSLAAACGSPTAPTPTLQTENFSGTLQPLGLDFKTFSIGYTQGATDLSITVNGLTTVANATPVTGITIGIGLGAVSASSCVLQIQAPAATLGQELFAPNGASAGSYCVQIFDCPTGATGCTPTLTEAVNYTMTVKHY